ncbi:hypothetical protein D6C90_06695 [Aureobasidium pullulans]|uniref:DUF6699 domain-containing protein n=1 Tax=Aureobasidium pullulans TaxID=5580 RepID=A0A4S9UGA1_AURPU|nr:hypothetical protein D6C90_06695 [Aureobasidium pullulans]
MSSTIELPKNVWFEVMSHLDYFDLKSCMSAIIPVGGTIQLARITMHPVFGHMFYECATELEGVYVGDGMDILTDTCAAEEYATDPPVAFLRIRVVEWAPVQITSKTGVTVLQVMKTLCRFFSNDDHRDSRGDHTGWHGWDEVKLDRKGRLLLCADSFDS